LKFNFQFNSVAGMFRSLREPVHEIQVPTTRGKTKVQVRPSGDDMVVSLRLSTFGNIQYWDLSPTEALELSDALETVCEIATAKR